MSLIELQAIACGTAVISYDKYEINTHLKDLKEITFANNDVEFTDSTGIDHNQFSFGLKKSLYNYLHGMCFDYDLQEWFDFKIPKTSIDASYIEECLAEEQSLNLKLNAKLVWLGAMPNLAKANKKNQIMLSMHSHSDNLEAKLEKEKGEWLLKILGSISVLNDKVLTLKEVKTSYEERFEDFELFWFSKAVCRIKEFGLLEL